MILKLKFETSAWGRMPFPFFKNLSDMSGKRDEAKEMLAEKPLSLLGIALGKHVTCGS